MAVKDEDNGTIQNQFKKFINGKVDFLKAHNCDEIQGYFYSKPLDYNSFIDFLDSKKSK